MVMEACEEYVALAEEYGITPTELALAWANQRPYNASVITGTTTVKQVVDCVNAFKLELPEDLMSKIDIVNEKYRSPIQYYGKKEDIFKASWLGDNARHAKDAK
jgi:aryl-alcohol dehydrogenase-like predicted oxidoreductase